MTVVVECDRPDSRSIHLVGLDLPSLPHVEEMKVSVLSPRDQKRGVVRTVHCCARPVMRSHEAHHVRACVRVEDVHRAHLICNADLIGRSLVGREVQGSDACARP